MINYFIGTVLSTQLFANYNQSKKSTAHLSPALKKRKVSNISNSVQPNRYKSQHHDTMKKKKKKKRKIQKYHPREETHKEHKKVSPTELVRLSEGAVAAVPRWRRRRAQRRRDAVVVALTRPSARSSTADVAEDR